MKRFTVGLLFLIGLALGAAPASAVNVPECGGDFIIFAKEKIIFEAGATLLTGDIFVQSATGEVRVGANNILHGTVSANKIVVGNGAVIDECVANTIELLGTGKCTVASPPGSFNPTPACLAAAPIPLPAIPAVCNPGTVVNIPNNTPGATLAPGCYTNVRIGKNSTLTLTPGGTYFFKGVEVRLLEGATLISGAGKPDAAATVNIQGNLITENKITLNNLNVNVNSTSGQAVQVFFNSIYQDVVLNAPLGNNHPHAGSQLRGNTELIAKTFFDIQPITNETPPVNDVCRCAPGFHFLNSVPQNPADRVCVPD